MTVFYVNQYPILNSLQEGNEYKDIPEGTTFLIKGISGNMFELRPVKDIGNCCVLVDYNMLKFAFYETPYIKD